MQKSDRHRGGNVHGDGVMEVVIADFGFGGEMKALAIGYY